MKVTVATVAKRLEVSLGHDTFSMSVTKTGLFQREGPYIECEAKREDTYTDLAERTLHVLVSKKLTERKTVCHCSGGGR